MAFIRSQFLHAIFRLTRPKSINRRAEVIDELERNWREEKRLIDYTVKKKACNAHQIWCATFVPTGTPYMA